MKQRALSKAEYEASVRRGIEERPKAALDVAYDTATDVVTLRHVCGATIHIPSPLFPHLSGAAPDDLTNVELAPDGLGLAREPGR